MPHPATQRIKAALAERFQKKEWAVPLAFRERPSKVQMRYLMSEDDAPADVFSALGGAGQDGGQAGPEVFQELLSQGLSSFAQEQQEGAMAQGMDPSMGMDPMAQGMDPSMAMQPGMMPPGAPQAMPMSPGAGGPADLGGIDPMMLMAALYGG